MGSRWFDWLWMASSWRSTLLFLTGTGRVGMPTTLKGQDYLFDNSWKKIVKDAFYIRLLCVCWEL